MLCFFTAFLGVRLIDVHGLCRGVALGSSFFHRQQASNRSEMREVLWKSLPRYVLLQCDAVSVTHQS